MTRRSRLGLFPAAALLLAVLGCSEQREAQEAGAFEAQLIEPRAAVGRIKAGMTLDQVVELLGEPQLRTSNALEYTRLGFAVMPGPDKVVQVVMCGDVTGVNGPLVKAFNGRTKEGIGLTSTRDELVKVFGQPTSSQSFPGARESLKYEPLGITFSLEAGKVHHMIIRLSPPDQSEPSIEVTR